MCLSMHKLFDASAEYIEPCIYHASIVYSTMIASFWQGHLIL